MIIFDASTLILLAKIDILQLVLIQYSGIIPEIVKEEVEYKNSLDAKLIEQQIKEGKLKISKNPGKEKMQTILKDFPLCRGEAAAIILANEQNGTLATDDGLAMKVCKIFGIKFITAVHFLIEAKLEKTLAIAKLNLLKKYGRYSIEIIRDATERIEGQL